MRIQKIQLSNILSFKYYDEISFAPTIPFDNGINILIGQNGAGKSTALEVINFIFKKVLFTQVTRNQELYNRRRTITNPSEKRNTLINNSQQSFSGFRLDPNWNTPELPQTIKIDLELDSIDEENIKNLAKHADILKDLSSTYSNDSISELELVNKKISITISLNRATSGFTAIFHPSENDPGVLYLKKYNFYKEIIYLYNIENPDKQIPNLYETFALIGGYRNYHAFTPSISLSDQLAPAQMQAIRVLENDKSSNSNDQNEPSIFRLVRLRIADKHYQNFGNGTTTEEAEQLANKEEFLVKINAKLSLVNLKIVIQLTDKQKWSYSIGFFDTKLNKPLLDVNSLSAGQKAIIHLIFEAYGRGDLKGGVVVIDEPEIHLHYQFQYEYLRIISELNDEQYCQYILVTHSESLINSKTIGKVRRFYLDPQNYTCISFPNLKDEQKNLIKILDNTRSTYAFFAKKILLVEGDSDRYFFKSLLQELKPTLTQEIAVLDIGGKGNYKKWHDFFIEFGLAVFYIGDFDNTLTLNIDGAPLIDQQKREHLIADIKKSKLQKLNQTEKAEFKELCDELTSDSNFSSAIPLEKWKAVVDKFISFVSVNRELLTNEIRREYTDIDSKIESLYARKIFILKLGSIEEYIGTEHANLEGFIKFCENNLKEWLKYDGPKPNELKFIINSIVEN